MPSSQPTGRLFPPSLPFSNRLALQRVSGSAGHDESALTYERLQHCPVTGDTNAYLTVGHGPVACHHPVLKQAAGRARYGPPPGWLSSTATTRDFL